MNINVRVVIEEDHGLGVERVEIELSDLATRDPQRVHALAEEAARRAYTTLLREQSTPGG